MTRERRQEQFGAIDAACPIPLTFLPFASQASTFKSCRLEPMVMMWKK
jgi:hypothetical protein